MTLAGVKSIQLDLAEKASIDAAVDECGGPVHALFSCAGVADGTPGIERINFIGHRHMIDRMLAAGMLPRVRPSASSLRPPGLGWQTNLDALQEFLDITDFDEAARMGSRQQQGRLHVEQAGDQRLRRARGIRAS